MIRAFRRDVGAFLTQTVRGFEFALAVATIINAHYALLRRPDGSPVAPFLITGVRGFSYEPRAVSLLFGVYGVILLWLFFSNNRGGELSRGLLVRAVAHSVLVVFYLAITLAILRGTEPPAGCERYAFTAFVAMCCVACHLRLMVDRRKAGGKGGDPDAR